MVGIHCSVCHQDFEGLTHACPGYFASNAQCNKCRQFIETHSQQVIPTSHQHDPQRDSYCPYCGRGSQTA